MPHECNYCSNCRAADRQAIADKEYQAKQDTISTLKDLLNDCLASGNQDHSFRVLDLDTGRMKLLVEFDVVEVKEDGYVGFKLPITLSSQKRFYPL